MRIDSTPIESYPFLHPFQIRRDVELLHNHLNHIRQVLVTHSSIPTENPIDYMRNREKAFGESVQKYRQEQLTDFAKTNLQSDNSFDILMLNTHLTDAMIQFCFEYVLEDLTLLKVLRTKELQRHLQYKQKTIPEKREKLSILVQQIQELENNSDDIESHQMTDYYQGIHDNLQIEIETFEREIIELEATLVPLEKCKVDQEHVKNHLVIFARGGYGRGELSFASDLDLGYCLDVPILNRGEVELYRELITRIEHLLNVASIETASQYFEINENLSRFTELDTIHTIPSILESRALLGSEMLFERLKKQFYDILPYEPYVLSKIDAYKNQNDPSLNEMNVKEDTGGLRTLQVPLWIAAATFGVFPSQTADLLALMIQKNVISFRQAVKLCEGLEFLYDLRNFVGLAKEYYFDEEAQNMGCSETDFQKDIINDTLEKLYLIKKKRFQSVDEFDRFRLSLVNNIQSLSRLILRRLLDRTVVRTFKNFQIQVHLRKKEIQEIHAIEGLPQIPLHLLLQSPIEILDLFTYISYSDYDLSPTLIDEMADIIPSLTIESIEAYRSVIAEKFTNLMMAPYVHKSLSLMFQISETFEIEGQPRTLLGCFIPECNQMRYLLRNLTYHQHPVCEHTLKGIANTHKELNLLKQNYTELHAYLQPKHILALKWAMLFHDVGKIDSSQTHEHYGTRLTKNALQRLGYEDDEFFELVNLMIYHHTSITRLSKTATYFDQALLRFFEIADRNLINMILLFLINICDYQAVSETCEKDTKGLRELFDEMYRIFAEARFKDQVRNPERFIQLYLLQKKEDIRSQTRINLLIDQSLQTDITQAIMEPLAQIADSPLIQLQSIEAELTQYWRYLKMGSLNSEGVEKYTEKMIKLLRMYLSDTTIDQLTATTNKTFDWFFQSFPNRFILSMQPAILAQALLDFLKFEQKSIVSIITNARGRAIGLLVHVYEQQDIHGRVAYALHLKNINIASGKMNKVIVSDDRVAFCHYFKISSQPAGWIFPRDLEQSILEVTPLELKPLSQDFVYSSKTRIEFLDNDQKGYQVIEKNGKYIRKSQKYSRIKVTTEDAPLVYYKITHTIEQYGVMIQQSLITTIGHQVADYFYFTENDYEKLYHSNFSEVLMTRLM